jgi:hypothetical protein
MKCIFQPWNFTGFTVIYVNVYDAVFTYVTESVFVHCISSLNEPSRGSYKIQCLPRGKYVTSIKKLLLLMTFLESIETIWVKYLVH